MPEKETAHAEATGAFQLEQGSCTQTRRGWKINRVLVVWENEF